MSGSSSSQSSRSSNTSSSIGIGRDLTGNMLDGNNNTITQTDHGAIESAYYTTENALSFAENANDNLATVVDSTLASNVALASESLSLAESLGSSAHNLGAYGIDAGIELGKTMSEASSFMLSDALDSNVNVINNAALLLDSSSARSLDAALSVTEASVYQSELGFDFARDLVAQNGEAALMQQNDNNTALGNGFASMMQFADNVSRSDGANLAKSTNTTFMVIAIVGVVGFFIAKKWGK